MIKVAINTTPLKSGHASRGIGFYTKYLVEYLKKIEDLQIQEFSTMDELSDAEVVHFPFFDLFSPTLPFKKKLPTIVTVHDVVPLLFPEQYPPGIKGKIKHLIQRKSLAGVAGVITDSQTSKVDINRVLQVPNKKISAIALAPAEHFKLLSKPDPAIVKKYQLPERFGLFVGSVNWNKNILGIAKGCIDADLDCYFVGKNFDDEQALNHPERASYQQFLEQFRDHPKIHIIGFASDEDLVQIYNLAWVTLLPSWYEGFGLTILESQSCGTPVITSNNSSMKEVVQDSALLVDPDNSQEIAEAIKQLEDQKLYQRLVQKGLSNAKSYSWSKTAQQTYQVYLKVLHEHN